MNSWCRTFHSLPLSSQVLLKKLAGQEQLPPDLPLYELSLTLYQIVARGTSEEKTLAQVNLCVVCNSNGWLVCRVCVLVQWAVSVC